LSVSYRPENIYELVLFRLINKCIIQSVKQYTNHYNLKFKMLLLIKNACVFRYFSTGQSFRSLAFSFRMDHYTVGKIVDEVDDIIYIYIYLIAVGLTPGGSSTSHIYTQTVRITQR
jgi:hypothetical protein